MTRIGGNLPRNGEGRGVETHGMVGRNEGGREAGSRNPAASNLKRRFSTVGVDPLETVEMEPRRSVITNPDGSVVFEMEGVEVPAGWSQLATDIVVSKYFRKAGLHGDADGGETSVRQVVHRIAHTIREAGETLGGYFATARTPTPSRPSWPHMLVHQYGAFNSPVWFNCGLCHEYGIDGLGRQLRLGSRTRTRSARPRTPTSARSARRASSSRSTTT